MRRTYKKGTKPTLRVRFTDPDSGDLLDPVAVVLKILDPSANVTTLVFGTDQELTKAAVGVYEANANLDEAGVWRWTYTGTTANDAVVVEGELVCEDPGF